MVPTEKLDIPIEDFYRQTAKAKRIFGSPTRRSSVAKFIVRPQTLSGAPYTADGRPGTSQKAMTQGSQRSMV